MSTVLWFSRLKPGVDPASYEDWVREVDYRLAAEIDCIRSYRVYRVPGGFTGEAAPEYDYVEIVHLTDIEEYRGVLKSHPAMDEILAQIDSYVEAAGNAICELVEPNP